MTTNTYKYTFQRTLSDKEKAQILDLAKTSVLDKVKAEFYLSKDDLQFNVPFLTSKQNLFSTVDKGKFTFNNNTFTYKIFNLKSLTFLIIFAFTLAFGSGHIKFFLIIFGTLIFLNMITLKVRHNFFFKDLVSRAETSLINANSQI